MKRSLFIISAISSGLFASINAFAFLPIPTAADLQKKELASVGPAKYTASWYKPGKVEHIVIFKFAPEISPEQKDDVKKRFLALGQNAKREGSPYIVSVIDEAAEETSGEGADQGFEQRYVVIFKSLGDRNYYVGQPIVADPKFYDPAHQAFKDFVGPLLDYKANPDNSKTVTGVVVMDFVL